jgi:hypothetical protein
MGLYDDDTKDATTGDLNDQDYWWTKFDMNMLDLALKQRQPEGHIGLNLASTIRRLDELAKKYPRHELIKQWKDKANAVNGKINPGASRGEPFKPGCPWDEANFAQAWVNYHHGKMLLEANDLNSAYGSFLNVKQNFEILRRPDRMKDYPADLRGWVEGVAAEVDKTFADLKVKTHH